MFITRTISGAVMLGLSVLFIILGGIPLAGVTMLLSVGAYYEMTKALFGKRKFNALTVFGYIAIAAYYVAVAVAPEPVWLLMVVVFAITLFLAIYVVSFPKYDVNDTMQAIFAFVYGPLLLSFLPLTRGLENGKYIVWMIYISSWGYDTCAYLVGVTTAKTCGNHKIFPKLSPKKSLEGIIGGVVGAALIALLYGNLVMKKYTDIPNVQWMCVIMAAVGALIAQVGDLAASAVKRNKEIKDYSKLIPGHGGILDRFDSMMFTAPITYFLALLLLSVNG